jgi:hypothetical protein
MLEAKLRGGNLVSLTMRDKKRRRQARDERNLRYFHEDVAPGMVRLQIRFRTRQCPQLSSRGLEVDSIVRAIEVVVYAGKPAATV